MEYSVQKTVESSLFRGLTPTFHVIFHIICFFTTNGDITDCKSLENSQGNFHDGVSLIKVISRQFSDCNFAIMKIHDRFFLENVTKTSCLKRNKESLF